MVLDKVSDIQPIELRVSNLYANGRILVFSDGTQKLRRDRVEYVATEPDDYYTVKIDDSITKIAYDFYKDKVELPSHFWWIIADANKIRNPLDLSALVGEEIVIPNILNFQLKN